MKEPHNNGETLKLCLVIWHHPNLSVISPAVILTATSSGIYAPLAAGAGSPLAKWAQSLSASVISMFYGMRVQTSTQSFSKICHREQSLLAKANIWYSKRSPDSAFFSSIISCIKLQREWRTLVMGEPQRKRALSVRKFPALPVVPLGQRGAVEVIG